MRVRCLVSEASPYWEYRRGLVYEVPDEQAKVLISMGKAEYADRKCPNCGHDLGEIPDLDRMAAPVEAAALRPAAKRG